MGRMRIVLIALILIVLVVVVVVVVLPALNPPAPAPVADDSGVQTVQQPESTPLPTATPIIFVDLVIAVQELPRGIVIPPNAVALRPWPQDAAPFNGITNVD